MVILLFEIRPRNWFLGKTYRHLDSLHPRRLPDRKLLLLAAKLHKLQGPNSCYFALLHHNLSVVLLRSNHNNLGSPFYNRIKQGMS